MSFFDDLRVSIATSLIGSQSRSGGARDKLLEKMQAVDSAVHRRSIAEVIAEKEATAAKGLQDEEAKLQVVEEAIERRLRGEMKLKTSSEAHPVLDNLIVDLGYKKIYSTTAVNLSSIPVWEKQRVYRHNRAREMALEKMKDEGLGGVSGVISCVEDRSGNLSIIDGQHRVGMLSILNKKRASDPRANDHGQLDFIDKILVEVYQTPKQEDVAGKGKSGDFVEKMFTEINKAEPIKLVDLPGMASPSVQKLLNTTVSNLAKKNPAMFSNSSRCRPPHLNVDNLRDLLFTSGCLKKHEIKGKVALTKWLEAKNKEVKKRVEMGEFGDGAGVRKARANNFYLGLDSRWVY